MLKLASCGVPYVFKSIKPFGKHHASNFLERRSEPLTVIPRLPGIEAGLCELGGMANQPSFDFVDIDFGVELRTKAIVAEQESLMGTVRRCCEIHRARRQSEIVTVPMKNLCVLQMPRRR